MRFDDRLATVLAQSADSESERQALWRQLTDLLAQEPGDAPSRQAAFARLREWRNDMPEQVRRSAAAALAWQELPDDLILFFAEDMPSIAAPVLGTAFALAANAKFATHHPHGQAVRSFAPTDAILHRRSG